MTLLQCSDKIFRPWDDHHGREASSPDEKVLKLQPEDRSVSESYRKSGKQSLTLCNRAEVYPALPQQFSPLFPVSPLQQHFSQLPGNQPWFQLPCGILPPDFPRQIPGSFEELLATFESSPEAFSASKLAEMSELYNLTIRKDSQHPQTSADANSTKKQRPKRFRCPHCDVAFSNNGQLKGHIRSHTGERPFKCDVESCNKTFTRNEELTRHKRIHTGVRPFPCSVCGKKFGRRDHLKKHTRTHQRPAPVNLVPFPYMPFIGGAHNSAPALTAPPAARQTLLFP